MIIIQIIKQNSGFFRLILLLCICLLIAAPAYAGTEQEVSVTVPIQQVIVDSANPGRIVGEYVLTGMEASNPMPVNSVDSQYVFSLRGDVSKQLDPMVFTETGVYLYQIKQTSVNRDDIFYPDKTIYTIGVYVNRKDDGTLNAVVIAENQYQMKTEDLRYVISYRFPDRPDEETESTANENIPDQEENGIPEGGMSDEMDQGIEEVPKGDVSDQKKPEEDNGVGIGVPTGDETKAVIWFAAALLSIGILLLLLITKSKHRRN